MKKLAVIASVFLAISLGVWLEVFSCHYFRRLGWFDNPWVFYILVAGSVIVLCLLIRMTTSNQLIKLPTERVYWTICSGQSQTAWWAVVKSCQDLRPRLIRHSSPIPHSFCLINLSGKTKIMAYTEPSGLTPIDYEKWLEQVYPYVSIETRYIDVDKLPDGPYYVNGTPFLGGDKRWRHEVCLLNREPTTYFPVSTHEQLPGSFTISKAQGKPIVCSLTEAIEIDKLPEGEYCVHTSFPRERRWCHQICKVPSSLTSIYFEVTTEELLPQTFVLSRSSGKEDIRSLE